MFVQADLELLLIDMMGLLVCGIDVCEWALWVEITHLKQPFICTFLGFSGYYVLAILIILIYNETGTFLLTCLNT
jgi:hypothetical protein